MMKDNKNKKMFIILPIIILSFLLILVGVSYAGKLNGKRNDGYNNYVISDKISELDGTTVVKSDELSREHCLDDICVKDVVVYNNNDGRIEYVIVNNGSKETSGILKMNFGDISAYVAYSALQPGQSVKSLTVFHMQDYSNVKDYKLEKLTDDELSKIKTY